MIDELRQAFTLAAQQSEQEQRAGAIEQIKAMQDYAAELLANPPPIPDGRIGRDRGMKRYVQDLLERGNLASAAAGREKAAPGGQPT